MHPKSKRDLEDSAYDFQRLVWPAISPLCGGGTFKPVEGHANEDFQDDLDTLAGIDGVQILPGRIGMRGIASRIQWGDKSWESFTIRETRGTGAKTELEKRLHAINHPDQGLILPHLTVQAYISARRTGRLLSVGVALTKELIPYADEMYRSGKKGVERKPVRQDDGTTNYFLAIYWTPYIASGHHVDMVRPGKHRTTSTEKLLGMPLDEFLEWVEKERPRMEGSA